MYYLDEFPNYGIDEQGNVFSFKSNQFIRPIMARVIKGNKNQAYWSVILKKEGKSYQRYIHRLLAQTFIFNSEKKATVNHKDGNRLNNNLDNLEWTTQKENVDHALDILHTFQANRKLKSEDISIIFQMRKKGIRYKEIAKQFNVSHHQIRSIIHGRQWITTSKQLGLTK